MTLGGIILLDLAEYLVTASLRLPILAEIHFFLNGLAYDGEYYMNEVVKVAGQLILPEPTHTIPH